MKSKLFDYRAHDGSRQFAALPEVFPWELLRDRINELSGALVTDYMTDNVTEMWLDFSFRGHKFTVNNQFGEFWFFVQDPACPDEVLTTVIEHCVRS